jgi:hypothetical protein
MSLLLNDVEQKIFDCWKITEDLELVYEEICNDSMTPDRIANILLGLKELYQFKFDRLHNTFYRLCDETCKEKAKHEQDVLNALNSTQGLGPNGPNGPDIDFATLLEISEKMQAEQEQKIKIEENSRNSVLFKNKL